MKKVIIIIAFFVLIISIFLIKIQAVSYPPEKVLAEAFESSGAATVSSELYLRGKLDDTGRAGSDSAKALIRDVLESLGAVGENPDLNSIGDKSGKGIELDFSLSGGRKMHVRIVDGKETGDKGGKYVTINLVDASPAPDLAGQRAALEKAVDRYGIGPKFSSCITGRFDGKIGAGALNEACVRVFKKAEARKVEGIREGSLISVSAFSNTIRESVDDDGRKVNLNLAIRYNSYEDKTYLWLATPVIITEY